MDPEAQPERTSRVAEDAVETVLIQVPADADYVAVIRSAAAHVATRFGGTLSEVADLRLAVDEACGLLLRHTVRHIVRHTARDRPAAAGAGVGDLECRFVLDASTLRVVLGRQAWTSAPPQDDDFGWTILSALVDDIVWRAEGSTVQVEILKRRTVDRRATSPRRAGTAS
ncbi:ATP-binding protein [Catenulispora rubra]|uniref:ATP-binding protein n=1 Tax=Catenulispora rubra TaxID=280293 RepID=UPI0018920290|nr:ATP-binding protein [Catenulispora rubra]